MRRFVDRAKASLRARARNLAYKTGTEKILRRLVGAKAARLADVYEALARLAHDENWAGIEATIQGLPREYRGKNPIRAWQAVVQSHTGPEADAFHAAASALTTSQFEVASRALDVIRNEMDFPALVDWSFRAVQADPSDEMLRRFCFSLAVAGHADGPSCEAILDIVGEEFADRPAFLIRRAFLLAQMRDGRLDAARADMNKALSMGENLDETATLALESLAEREKTPGNIAPGLVELGTSLARGVAPTLENPDRRRRLVKSLQGLNRADERAFDEADLLDDLAKMPCRDAVSVRVATNFFFAKGRPDLTERVLQDWVAANPGPSDPLYRLAGVLAGAGKPDEAVQLMRKEVPNADRGPKFLMTMGHIQAWSGQIDEGLESLRASARREPNNGWVIADMAFCSEFTRQYARTVSLMEHASNLLEFRPAPYTIGIELMLNRRLRRRMCFAADLMRDEVKARALHKEWADGTQLVLPFEVDEWREGPVEGKSVIVLADQGIGDEIRYTSTYRRRLGDAREVWLTCDPRLEGLMTRSFPEFRVIPVRRNFPGMQARRADVPNYEAPAWMRKLVSHDLLAEGQEADLWLHSIKLFETDAFDHSRLYQSPETPVLHAEPSLAQHYAETLRAKAGGRPVIGLSWRGGRQTYNRDTHYFTLDQWRPLFEQLDACFVNLQYAETEAELAELRAALGDRFIEFPDLDLFDDMEGVAALCSGLDMVVSVCTSVLEMTGALGVPALYLMRSPQVTHAIRLHGQPDRFGAQQDSVWKTCKIMPRFDIDDATLIDNAAGFIAEQLGCARPADTTTGQTKGD